MAELEFHPLAIAEARAARLRYAQVSQTLAARFVAALDVAVAAVESNPSGHSTYLHGTRVVRVRRFPYLLVYLELTTDRALAVAVAHGRRKPGYWRQRLPSP